MRTIALCIADESNEYQQMVREDARQAAARAGMKLEVYSADDNIMQQIRQIYECLHREAANRPVAIVIMPVRVTSLGRIALEVLRAGVGWVCLHRWMDDIPSWRREFPDLPIGFVSPDQHEIGRIQGRQFRALLPAGGQILYVRGEATSSSAQGRLEGMRDALEGTNLQLAGLLDGNWTTDTAERVVSNWLRIVMAGKSRLDLIGCQNDAMAVGAIKALKSVAAYMKRPEVAQVPVSGCDGVPNFGQKMVRDGQLVSTVVIPSTGAPAIDLVVRALNRGKPPAEVLLPSTSYPAEAVLAQRARPPK